MPKRLTTPTMLPGLAPAVTPLPPMPAGPTPPAEPPRPPVAPAVTAAPPPGIDAAVTFRMFASARAAAGTHEVQVAPGPTASVIAALAEATPAPFTDVLAVSSLIADGTRLDRSSHAPLAGGLIVDVLPPFAGG